MRLLVRTTVSMLVKVFSSLLETDSLAIKDQGTASL